LRKKIWSDVVDNLGRTLQAVLIIAIGSIAIGSIMGSTELIQQDITNGWLRQSPASIGLSLGGGGVSKELVDTMGKYPEIDQIEGQFSTGIKWRRSPNDPWEPATLIAREDYQDLKLFELILEDGDWPRNKVMTANRGYGLQTGDRILIEGDRHRRCDLVHERPPAQIWGKSGLLYHQRKFPGHYRDQKV
jgi:hypothetical protein